MSDTRIALYVVDTGPLITLAAADSLDYLLYPNVDVVIPDAVVYEATRDLAKLGAQSIIDWIKLHHARIEVAVTNSYANFTLLRSVNPTARAPNLGEQAAVEVIEEPGRLQGDARAVLLCEESAVMRRIIVQDRLKIVEMSTMDFLRMLQDARRIQSADAVFDLAGAAGRTPSRAEKFADHDPAIRDAIRETLQAAQARRDSR